MKQGGSINVTGVVQPDGSVVYGSADMRLHVASESGGRGVMFQYTVRGRPCNGR